MIEPNKIVRVLAITDPGSTQEQIFAALTAQSEFELVKTLSSLDKFVKEIHAAEPDLMLVGHQVAGQSTIDVIDDIVLQFPDVPLIAILPNADSVRAQQVTLAGARAFLNEPFTQANLLSTMRRVRDLEARRFRGVEKAGAGVSEGPTQIRTFALFSPRGGVGVSTLAANLAVALHEQTTESTLLVDGKLYFGHIDLLLNIRSRNNIADLVPHASLLDSGIINDIVVEHASGIQVLCSPTDFQVAQGFRAEDIYNILNGLKRSYHFVLIDVGSALTEVSVTMLDAADRILMVTTPDLASLHDTSRFIQISRTLSYLPEKMMIILNRANLVGGVRTKDIETALRHEVFAQIPDDGPNALRSIDRGIPMILRYPRSPVSQAVVRLAKSLAELGQLDSTFAVASSKAKKPAKSATSQTAATVPNQAKP